MSADDLDRIDVRTYTADPRMAGSEFDTKGMSVVVGQHAVTRQAVAIPISQEMLDDDAFVHRYLGDAFDRALRPWRHPDKPAMPRIPLYPRLQATADRIHSAHRRLTRRQP